MCITHKKVAGRTSKAGHKLKMAGLEGEESPGWLQRGAGVGGRQERGACSEKPYQIAIDLEGGVGEGERRFKPPGVKMITLGCSI